MSKTTKTAKPAAKPAPSLKTVKQQVVTDLNAMHQVLSQRADGGKLAKQARNALRAVKKI